MTEPRSDDLLKSRQEAALLLRLDPENLSASDALRCDLIATLRLSIDSAQADALEGRAADLGRLIVATESLVKLLPSEQPQPNKQADPRQIMWETYLGMRRRGELADPMSTFEGRAAEVERLKAKIAELEAALAGSVPLPPNAVKLRNDIPSPSAPASAAPPAAPQPAAASTPRTVDVNALPPAEPERWRAFVNADGSIRSQPRGRWDV